MSRNLANIAKWKPTDREKYESHRLTVMDYKEVGNVDGAPIRVPNNNDYRTCSVCLGDCEPDLGFGSDESGARIAFICPEHGIQSLVDAFEGRR